MKSAICLFGISRQEITRHGRPIDYRKSIKNYKEHLFPYFLSRGTLDIYLCTNTLSKYNLQDLVQDYEPFSVDCIENLEDFRLSRSQKITKVVSNVIESKKEYDLICITRFDLIFADPLEKANLDLTKMNNVSILELDCFICDNFYLFPGKMLTPFYKTLLETKEECPHKIKEILEKNIGEKIHFIKDERCLVADLSFYKIVR